MASHTLTELQGILRNRIPVASTDTQLTATVLTSLINTALQAVSAERNWPWLLTSTALTTVAGTAGYATPTAWLSTDTIIETTTGLFLANRNRKDVLAVPTSVTGEPVMYSIDGSNIVLRPIPDAVYSFTHYYFKMEPALASGSDTPLVPVGSDEGVIEYATFLALRFRREDQRAIYAKKAYDDWVERMADNITGSRDTRAPRVRQGSAI